MKSINESLDALKAAKTDIVNSIVSKGGTVAEGDGFTKFSSAIDGIPPLKGEFEGSGIVVDSYDEITGLPKNITLVNMENIPSGMFMTYKIEKEDSEDLVLSFWSLLEEITIEDGTISIGDYAFANNESLKRVTIPEYLKSIGEKAFSGCSSLEEFAIDNVEELNGVKIFEGCIGLKKVWISEVCTSIINDSIFLNCDLSLKIFCEVEEKPEGWTTEWNKYGVDEGENSLLLDVAWGAERGQYESYSADNNSE